MLRSSAPSAFEDRQPARRQQVAERRARAAAPALVEEPRRPLALELLDVQRDRRLGDADAPGKRPGSCLPGDGLKGRDGWRRCHA
jgi:hypothetical protein